MAWRVIVRVGLNGDLSSVLRNTSLIPEFENMGLQNTATGTWEANHVSQTCAAQHLSVVLNSLASPQSTQGVSQNARLQHLWIYIDYVADPAFSSQDEDV